MSIFKRLINVIRNSLKYYSNIVITYKYSDQAINPSPVKIVNVSYDNYKDASIYEPIWKVEQFKKFLDDGDIGYYAYLDGKYVHRSWVTFGKKIIPLWYHFVPLKMDENEAFIGWCETVPSARGNNIYSAVLSRIANDLSNKLKTIYGATTIDNIASQRGLQKAGFIEIEKTRVISFMHITFQIPVK